MSFAPGRFFCHASLALATLGAGLACNKDGNSGNGSQAGLNLYRGVYATSTGPIDQFDVRGLLRVSRYDADVNLSLVADRNIDLYGTRDSGGTQNIRVLNRSLNRFAGFSNGRDGEIFVTGLNRGLGIVSVDSRDLLIVANSNGAMSNVLVIGKHARGSSGSPVAALGSTASFTTGEPRGIAYDEPRDRLYVAISDGTIAIYDNFLAAGLPGNLAPTARPGVNVAGGGAVILSGLTLLQGTDVLVLSNLGATSGTVNLDGSILLLAGASQLGAGNATAQLVGLPGTPLADPVALSAVNGSDVIGTDSATGEIFGITGLLGQGVFARYTLGRNSTAQGVATAADDREVANNFPQLNDLLYLDQDDNTRTNNTGVAGVFDSDAIPGIGGTVSVNAIRKGADNVLYASFTNGTVGGVVTLSAPLTGTGVANASPRPLASLTPDLRLDGVLSGAATQLVNPVDMALDRRNGLLYVAEAGATRAIRVFGAVSGGNSAPLFSITNLGFASFIPSGIAHEPVTDRLVVAGNVAGSGRILVYDEVSKSLGAGGPTQAFTPGGLGSDVQAATRVAVSFDPILEDINTDRLFIVFGDNGTGANNDGQIFGIEVFSEPTRDINGNLVSALISPYFTLNDCGDINDLQLFGNELRFVNSNEVRSIAFPRASNLNPRVVASITNNSGVATISLTNGGATTIKSIASR